MGELPKGKIIAKLSNALLLNIFTIGDGLQ
jgi:hypothetical protein